MSLTAVILDFERPAHPPLGNSAPAGPAAVSATVAGRSLLQTPIGSTMLLSHLVSWLRRPAVDAILVTSVAEADASCARLFESVLSGAAATTGVVRLAELQNRLVNAEAADFFLLIDPRRLSGPPPAFDRLLSHLARPRAVQHLVYPSRADGVRERVVYDRDHGVRRVERLYHGVTHFDVATVAASLFTGAHLRELPHPDISDLKSLRLEFVRHGVPSEDVALKDRVIDLESDAGLLQLSDRVLDTLTSRTPPAGFTAAAPDVWVSRSATVAPSARLYGPAVLQPGCRIGENAIVVGPAVVGAAARVGHRASIVHSVVSAGARVESDAFVRDQVVTGAAGRCWNGDPVISDEVVSAAREVLAARSPTPRQAARHETRRRTRAYDVVKRAADAVCAGVGLVILSPVLLAAALLIRLTSRGPVLFAHDREGRDGEVFRCLKFRTMVSDAHARQRALYQASAVDGPQFKLANDPRITRVGHWLRRTNLDELPQLINVVRGEMSLIGPRPSPFRENQLCVPWRRARLSVRPGITGLWQVCRRDRAYGDFHQWIHFDMLYVRHRSIGLDARILAATLLTLGGRWGVPLEWMIPSARDSRSLAAAGATQRIAGTAAPQTDLQTASRRDGKRKVRTESVTAAASVRADHPPADRPAADQLAVFREGHALR